MHCDRITRGHTTSCDVSGGVHHGIYIVIFTSLSLFDGMSKLTGTSVPKILFFKGGKAAVSVSLRGLTSVRKAFSTAFFIRSLLPSGPTKKATAPLYTLAARARASVKEEILIVARECYDMRRFWILDGGAKTMVCPQRNGEEHNKRRRLVGKRETSFTNKNGAYILKDSRCPLFGQKYYRDQRLSCWGILGTRPRQVLQVSSLTKKRSRRLHRQSPPPTAAAAANRPQGLTFVFL